MATAYITRFSTKATNFIQKPIIQRVYRFTVLQTIEIAEIGKQKALQLADMFPFKHSINELKEGALYIKNFDQEVMVNSTVKDMAVFSIVMAELVFWFFIGEIIGRRKVFGYRHIGLHRKSGHF